ncbi:hypothetical protein DFQ02_10285 [Seonamhaeicola aphaedonensis]|uniref:DNA polymerase-3 subunit gamma/tau n=1 Tax=Seonamhaeicola aphaedonensis TaxID=1461338 RepID=A0A3D9HIL0_9FLAO|nr:hypothetical protein DFQ02_10285 [Seonamhaeicola aphaedonensis]
MEKKKNSRHYIIPPSYFKNKGINPLTVIVPKQQKDAIISEDVKQEDVLSSPNETPTKVVESFQVKEPPKIILKQEGKRTSGLSLSSLKTKKEHQIRQMNVIIDEEDLPKDDFTERELIKVWDAYIENLQKSGKRNLASILSIDKPKVAETIIHLEYPTETNKLEIERNQYDLLAFIRKSLNNFDINLAITVNEVMEKQYAYTPIEKFERLKEKNPNIELLKKTFNLDV